MKCLTIVQNDGSKWAVPVDVIARNRAAHYAREFDGDIERSLSEDTLPLFESEPYEVEDWAVNNMNWSDVQSHAFRHTGPPPLTNRDFQDAWLSNDKDVEDVERPL